MNWKKYFFYVFSVLYVQQGVEHQRGLYLYSRVLDLLWKKNIP